MNKIKWSGVLMIFFLVVFSCSEDTPLEPAPTITKLSKLSEIQRVVFNGSCATSGCHAGASPAAGLNLTEGNSYSNLVNVTSVLSPPRKRVDEGNSAESVLVQILEGSVTPRMPQGGAPLSQSTIDSIAKWIDNGAPNN